MNDDTISSNRQVPNAFSTWARCASRIRYSLRSLLLFAILASLGIATFSKWMRDARAQRSAVSLLKAHGAIICYDYEVDSDGQLTGAEPLTPQWIRSTVGDDFVCSVHSVSFIHQATVLDPHLKHLAHLRGLQHVNLQNTSVSDHTLPSLSRHGSLQSLNLGNTSITDEGIRVLKGLTRLKWVSLHNTGISDEGIRSLSGLTELRTLDLSDTKVTDACIPIVTNLKGLEYLYIKHTTLSAHAVVEVEQRLPNCKVVR